MLPVYLLHLLLQSSLQQVYTLMLASLIWIWWGKEVWRSTTLTGLWLGCRGFSLSLYLSGRNLREEDTCIRREKHLYQFWILSIKINQCQTHVIIAARHRHLWANFLFLWFVFPNSGTKINHSLFIIYFEVVYFLILFH